MRRGPVDECGMRAENMWHKFAELCANVEDTVCDNMRKASGRKWRELSAEKLEGRLGSRMCGREDAMMAKELN